MEELQSLTKKEKKEVPIIGFSERIIEDDFMPDTSRHFECIEFEIMLNTIRIYKPCGIPELNGYWLISIIHEFDVDSKTSLSLNSVYGLDSVPSNILGCTLDRVHAFKANDNDFKADLIKIIVNLIPTYVGYKYRRTEASRTPIFKDCKINPYNPLAPINGNKYKYDIYNVFNKEVLLRFSVKQDAEDMLKFLEALGLPETLKFEIAACADEPTEVESYHAANERGDTRAILPKQFILD